jgi:hypothetical protein
MYIYLSFILLLLRLNCLVIVNFVLKFALLVNIKYVLVSGFCDCFYEAIVISVNMVIFSFYFLCRHDFRS